MINLKIFIIVIFTLLISKNSFSQNIAYANMDIIVKNSEVGKKIIKFFSDKNQKLSNDINDQEKKLIEKEKSLISQKNILTDEEFSNQVEIIRKEIEEFKKNRTKKLNLLNINKDKISKSFLSEINIVLRDYAEKNKIDIIISSNQMLVGKSSLDVTENILKDVNKKIKKFEIN